MGITNWSLCLEASSNRTTHQTSDQQVNNLTARFVRVSLTSLLLLVCSVASTLGQTGRRELTLDWIFGPEGRTVASVPATAWLDDGTLVILDDRRPANARTFEKLNPANGQRQALVDSVRALSDLKRTVDGMNTEALPWPLAFDGSGRPALYIFKGDVFVLELEAAHFRRLTSTPAEETSASFSPNGRRVAYVRSNNLYFFDLDNNRETQITRDGSETLLNGTLSWVYCHTHALFIAKSNQWIHFCCAPRWNEAGK